MKTFKSILLFCAALLLAGCAQIQLENSSRLMKRPDFEPAKTAAPEWCRDALKTINALEMEIEKS